MSRLIDADALMQTLGITDMDCDKCGWYSKAYRRCKRDGDFEDACCAIEDAPTIEAVPVIRCEDCRYMRIEGDLKQWCYCEQTNCDTESWGYCHRAERRTDETD